LNTIFKSLEYLPDHLEPLFQSEQTTIFTWVRGDDNHDAIENPQRALHEIHVSVRNRIKRAGIDRYVVMCHPVGPR